VSAGGLLKKISRLSRANSHPSLLDDSCCLGVGVQCHNVANGLGTSNRFARCYPANPTGADPHNRMDECGGCGFPLRSLAGTESRAARLRWRQRHRTFLGDSSAMEISGKCRTRARGEAGCPCLCFGWNSMGICKSRGFEMTRVLMVPHGGSRNDTVCTVEIKIKPEQRSLSRQNNRLLRFVGLVKPLDERVLDAADLAGPTECNHGEVLPKLGGTIRVPAAPARSTSGAAAGRRWTECLRTSLQRSRECAHTSFRLLSFLMFLMICLDLRGQIFRFQWENIFAILNWLSSLGLVLPMLLGKRMALV